MKSTAARTLARLTDRDTYTDQLEYLQDKLESLRNLIPHGKRKRGYALPTALILGGVATVAAVTILSIVVARTASEISSSDPQI